MKLLLWFKLALSMCIFDLAYTKEVHAEDLSLYQWEKRPLLVFTSRETHLEYARQMKILNSGRLQLDERDVVMLVDSKPVPPSGLRLEYMPGDFLLVLIGKDGEEKFRSNEPVTIEKLTGIIDAMPMRQQEMKQQN